MIENLTEGNYTFNFITYDDSGNHSKAVETLGLVYGELYESGLTARKINNISLNNNTLTIIFNSSEQLDKYYAQEITYTSSSDQVQKNILVPAGVSTFVINDYSGENFTHKSIFLPSELSPDFFYTQETIQYTPSKPLLVYPEKGATGISCAPEFQWHNSVLSTDGVYKLEYSTNQSNWISTSVTQKESLIPKTILMPNTTYYWRVSVTKGTKTDVSDINNFTTGEKTLYADGEVVCVLEHTSGLNPVRLVIMGDGFQQSDYNYNGLFDSYVEETVSTFFSVEPYKSYKEYFEVWKVAAYSDDGGISESDKTIRLNTIFESNFTGTTITCNTSHVYQYAKYIPNVDDDVLSEMATIVILNKRRQGGNTYVSDNCRSIALVPVYRNYTGAYTDFTNTIIRQGGGFAFGLLADESSSITGTLSTAEENLLKEAWNAGRLLNVDINKNPEEVRWAHFIGRSGYVRPNVYEGAYGYNTGLYRSEETSTMVNGIKYFNAISRELIVKRILSIAGKPYSLGEFIEKDVARTPYQ